MLNTLFLRKVHTPPSHRSNAERLRSTGHMPSLLTETDQQLCYFLPLPLPPPLPLPLLEDDYLVL